MMSAAGGASAKGEVLRPTARNSCRRDFSWWWLVYLESRQSCHVVNDPQQTIAATSSMTNTLGTLAGLSTGTFMLELGGQREPETLGLCTAGLTETAKRIDQPAIHHFPQLWESLVGL
jgi:hypothetical protein